MPELERYWLRKFGPTIAGLSQSEPQSSDAAIRGFDMHRCDLRSIARVLAHSLRSSFHRPVQAIVARG